MAETTSKPQYHLRIRELPSSERPRERLRDYGAGSLSNAELLAIILRTGSGDLNVLNLATSLLARHGGLDGLARLSFADLMNEKGLGEAKAAELLACFQIAARLQALESGAKFVIRAPLDVYMLLGLEMAFLDQEHLRVILLNSRNQVMAVKEIYVGNVNSAVVRPAEVFREAISQNAPGIVLVHNHPSGDPMPSPDDVAITKTLAEAGRLLGIEVMDHIVIGREGKKYISLQELGLGGMQPAR
jgi:DNA repair protein RadC